MEDLTAVYNPLMLLSGTANRELARGIAEELDTKLCDVTIKRFADGEIFVRINENVRGRDVFLIQSTNPPAENILELLILIDAAKRASAARVTAVIPYFGYGRADRKDQPRVSIAAKLMANVITAAGADRVLSIDFHQHQLQGFFDIPVDHLYAAPVIRGYFESLGLDNLVVVATDVGAAKMARGYAKRLSGDLAMVDKRRPGPNVAEVVNIVGDVEGKRCLIPDDMIDTAGTMTTTVDELRERGAAEIYIVATHALLSGPAVERLVAANVSEIVVTDTVAIPEETRKELKNLRVLSVSSLLSKAIQSTHTNSSVSSLFG
jgi:ribose-phosphate pyrophosphokinase